MSALPGLIVATVIGLAGVGSLVVAPLGSVLWRAVPVPLFVLLAVAGAMVLFAAWRFRRLEIGAWVEYEGSLAPVAYHVHRAVKAGKQEFVAEGPYCAKHLRRPHWDSN